MTVVFHFIAGLALLWNHDSHKPEPHLRESVRGVVSQSIRLLKRVLNHQGLDFSSFHRPAALFIAQKAASCNQLKQDHVIRFFLIA